MPYEKGLYVMNVHSPLRAIAQIDKNPFLSTKGFLSVYRVKSLSKFRSYQKGG